MPTEDFSRSDRRDWVRPTALAEREGISRRTVWRWVQQGKLEVQRKSARAGVRVREPDRSEE
jgi:predicted site-specific integrase-resolvase